MGYFSEVMLITAAVAGLACLVLAVRWRRPGRARALTMAAASLAAFGTLDGGSPTGPFLSTFFLLLAAGFAAYALPRQMIQETLAASRRAFSHRYEYMDRWIETSEKISSRLDTAEIKSFLSEMCAGAIGASATHIWLFDVASRSYIANSVSIEPAHRRIRTDHALIEHIKATGGAPFRLEELFPEEEVRILAGQISAFICAPLIAHREIIGFMLLGKKQGRAGYSEYDLRLLRAIATQAAVQVKNIRLSDDLLDMKESDLFNRMTSFVAHDLKNLTNSLSLLGHNARRSISDPAFQREALKALEATIARMRSLADKMAGGMRGLALSQSYSDLRQVLERAAGRLGPSQLAKLRVEDGEPVLCWMDEDQIETVFLNMLINASEATADTEEIRVSFRAESGSITVTITDNGSGIPMPFLENGLFRPFRTTKKDGFGIGLFQCKTVMEAHGGTIEVESEQGKGTSFTLKFQASLPDEASMAG